MSSETDKAQPGTTKEQRFMSPVAVRSIATGLTCLIAGAGFVAFMFGVSERSVIAGAIMLSTSAALFTWRMIANG